MPDARCLDALKTIDPSLTKDDCLDGEMVCTSGPETLGRDDDEIRPVLFALRPSTVQYDKQTIVLWTNDWSVNCNKSETGFLFRASLLDLSRVIYCPRVCRG